MIDFSPANTLERMLQQAQLGKITLPDFLKELVQGRLAVPSGTEVEKDGSNFQPLLFDKNGTKMIAAFTTKQRVGSFSKTAPYLLELSAKEFLKRVPPGYGVVLNPGQPVGLDISPNGLSQILKDFGNDRK